MYRTFKSAVFSSSVLWASLIFLTACDFSTSDNRLKQQARGPILKVHSMREIQDSLRDILNTTADVSRRKQILLGMERIIADSTDDQAYLHQLHLQTGIDDYTPILSTVAIAQMIRQDERIRYAMLDKEAADFIRASTRPIH
ncbi:MAG: hypothetical protein JWM78_1814 [Verrucomicrobiaceae bacterium]|nr:hypothetical protein [Verrucomicrobiaceae bacterium]